MSRFSSTLQIRPSHRFKPARNLLLSLPCIRDGYAISIYSRTCLLYVDLFTSRHFVSLIHSISDADVSLRFSPPNIDLNIYQSVSVHELQTSSSRPRCTKIAQTAGTAGATRAQSSRLTSGKLRWSTPGSQIRCISSRLHPRRNRERPAVVHSESQHEHS